MKSKKLLTIGLCIASLALALEGGSAASTSEWLQQGLYAEEVEGNMDKAIQAYSQVIQNTAASRSQVAQALYRQALCYIKIKNEAAARASLEKLVSEYRNQTEIVEKAMPLLQELSDFDPAELMPPGSLVYVEFGSPGRQLETVLGLLKGTPYENPFTAIGNPAALGGQGGGPDMMGALLNPSMLAEFKKIRGFAWGVTGVKLENPPWIAVLYPGKSDALRGLILAGLGMAGRPGEPMEGMQTVTIPLPGAQSSIKVAYDDRVMIAAQPASQLEWTVGHYKGLNTEPTLASGNKSFARVARSQRQGNALTFWANVAGTYQGLMKAIPQGEIPPQLLAANGFADFANIDSATITKSIDQGGADSRLNIQLKEGHHCLAYQMIHTPNIGKQPLEAVPANAIAVLSFSMSEALAAQAEKVRDQIRLMSGLEIGREVYSNIEQITLFAVPPKGESAALSAPETLHATLGLALTSRDPAQTRKAIESLLGAFPGAQGQHPAGQFKVGTSGNRDIICYLDQADGITVLSLNREVLEASVDALKAHKSVCNSGPFRATVSQMPPTTSKLVLANAGWMLRLFSPRPSVADLGEERTKEFNASLEQIARAAETTVVAVRADEQPNDLTLDCAVTGLPPMNQIAGPADVLARLHREAGTVAHMRELRLAMPALIMPASRPPAIDGKTDDAWDRCPFYNLANSLYEPPSSAQDLSATYRAMWDPSNLYVCVDVTDDVLKHESAPDHWYDSDSVEIYIDADNAKATRYGTNDYQYVFTWDKSAPRIQEVKHDRTEGVEYALVTTEKGYRVKVKFPWTALGVKPAAGAKIGLDVQVNDSDVGGKRKGKLAWHAREDNAYQSPQAFGNGELGGLVGWWKLNEKEGNVAKDSSGNGNDGKLEGHAVWRSGAGKFGGAIELNGKGDYIRIAHLSPFDIRAQITLSAWVNLKTVPQEWTGIVTKGDTAWRASTVYGEQRYHFGLGDGEDYLNGERRVTPGEWHHLVCVYDGSRMSIYLDGKLDASKARTGPIGANRFPVCIGNNAERPGRCWDGLVDDVRIYNYALSERELHALEASE